MTTAKEPLFVTQAEYAGGYKISLSFTDGATVTVDFERFLKSSLNPHIQKYLELCNFKQFSIQDGDLQWNDYDLCFPVADIYENNVSGLGHESAA